MKKILCALLCICVIFSLCACAEMDAIKNAEIPPLPTKQPEAVVESPEVPEATAEPAPTPAPQVTEPNGEPYGAELGDRVIVTTKKTQETYDIPDGPVILLFSYETPSVRIEERPQAAEEINEQIRLYDESYISGTGSESGRTHLLEEATDNYSYVMATGAELNTTFTAARTVKVMRADGSVVSFRYWTSVYAGGTRDRLGYSGCNYSTQTGEKLTLENLSSDPEGLKSYLAEQIISQAKSDQELFAVLSQGEGDMDTALSAIVRDGNWYFSAEGMVFFPEWGELVPADNDDPLPLFTIHYASLAGILDEQYLPAKREGDASFNVVRLSYVEDGTVWSIDRLNVSEGEELYLTVEGTAYDVSISKASYYDQGGEKNFFETDRLWYASFMTDCALQLNTAIPSGMPNLMISYTDSDAVEHRLLLSESGLNGGIKLVDDTIQAVG